MDNFVKKALAAGGDIKPLLIPTDIMEGPSLTNPSVLYYQNHILVNIRNVNYTLYHSELHNFEHRWGPLSYIHPEYDNHLRTVNYLAILNYDLDIINVNKVNTSFFDKEPLWDFVGLEDARLINWDNKLFLCGVRRDTTTNGQGRMELSEIRFIDGIPTEVSRFRIPAPNENEYCNKNWMPILDHEYHFVKWSNPLEIVVADPIQKTCSSVIQKPEYIEAKDWRGSSQLISYKNYYISLVHETNLYRSDTDKKDATYRHRFLVWDKNWNLIKKSKIFSFLDTKIEFCCGMDIKDNTCVITFGIQDNAAFILKVPSIFIEQFIFEHDKGFCEKNIDWGHLLSIDTIRQIQHDIFTHNDYEKFVSVKSGDVIVDIGSNVGAFGCSILHKNPHKLYCIEPSEELISLSKTNLTKYNKSTNIEYFPIAISKTNEFLNVFGSNNTVKISSFDAFIKQNSISKINFLKIDCEGSEYSIFDDDTINYLINNVDYIAMECHLRNEQDKTLRRREFKSFRDNYLHQFKAFKAMSCIFQNINPGVSVDLSALIFDDTFIDHYDYEFMLYIDNR